MAAGPRARSSFSLASVLTLSLFSLFLSPSPLLPSIADADAVLVLEAGRVAEHGPPELLMRTPGSAFRGMVEAAGRQGRAKQDGGGGSGVVQ